MSEVLPPSLETLVANRLGVTNIMHLNGASVRITRPDGNVTTPPIRWTDSELGETLSRIILLLKNGGRVEITQVKQQNPTVVYLDSDDFSPEHRASGIEVGPAPRRLSFPGKASDCFTEMIMR